MTIIAVLLAGSAGLLWFRTPLGRSLEHRLAPVDQHEAFRTTRAGVIGRLLPVLLAITLPLAAGSVFGARGFWLGLPIMIIALTARRVAGTGLARSRAGAARQLVAQACSILATQVRIGQPPLVAISSAAQDCPVLRPAVAIVDLGGDPAVVWRRQARTPGFSGLDDLARAWQLANRTGADMAESLDRVADALFEDDAVGLVVASEAAGPRASGKIMAVLPLAGIGLGYVIGGNPVQFLIGTPYGWGCLVLGTGLACVGVLWMEWVADHAAL